MPSAFLVLAFLIAAEPRARDIGIPFDGKPGKLNAITDVAGVEVGHETLISGNGKLEVGVGPVRTGVTAILPRGKNDSTPVFAGWHSLNGNGEMTGTTWIEESGYLEGPVMITNTHSVGVVRDAVIAWYVKRAEKGKQPWLLPVVAETFDGFLNDINGFHVKEKHAFAALDSAKTGPIAEGNVGGGTGMRCFRFAGGIGTASRVTDMNFTVGVLVQSNFGRRDQIRIAGIPMGEELKEDPPAEKKESGSIIIVIATDAPLLPHQLKRLARRVPLGLGRVGSAAGNGSGDIFVAFSTANKDGIEKKGLFPAPVHMLPNESMDPLFDATVQATEEAIVNALVGAKTIVGRDDNRAVRLPHDRVREILRRHGRLVESK